MGKNNRAPKTPRASAAEIETRVGEVLKLIVGGANRRQIQEKVKKDFAHWNIDQRQLDRYIQKANEEIAAASQFVRTFEIGRALYRTDDLYARTLKVQDYQRALAANDQRNKITGIYAPTQTQVTHLFAEAGVSIELITALFDALKAKGIPASEVFNSMLAQLAQEDVKP